MGNKLTTTILSIAMVASLATPAFASENAPTVKQQVTEKQEKVKTTWEHNGITINVFSDQPLSMMEMVGYNKQTDLQGKNASSDQASVSPYNNLIASTGGGPVMLPADPGSSFTLMNSQNKTFDNSMFYSAIYSTVSAIITAITLPSYLGAQVAGSAATGVLSTWINNKLGVRQIVYTNVRLGISFNTWSNFYEYVESSTHFANPDYTGVLDVTYGNTGNRVPDSTLAMYGLKNP